MQKQPPEVLCEKWCSKKFCKFPRKITMLESLWKKIAGIQFCNFIKKRLQDRCLPMKFAKLLRTPGLKKICKRLLLFMCFSTSVKRNPAIKNCEYGKDSLIFAFEVITTSIFATIRITNNSNLFLTATTILDLTEILIISKLDQHFFLEKD